MRKIIIGLIGVFLFTVIMEAKNINKLSSTRKFGFTVTSNTNYGKRDVIANGIMKVRYRYWWAVRSWSSGSYAKISLKKNGRRYKAKLICIEQGDVSHDNVNIFHNKSVCKKNVSSLYMKLNKYLGKIAVNYTVQTSTKTSRMSYNDWIND